MTDPRIRYHDRVAARYDDIYARDPYWEYYFDVGFRQVKKHLPRACSARILDVGCGTGLYGRAVMKSGFPVTFSDLSPKMLDRARANVEAEFPRRPAEFVVADLQDLSGVPDATFALVIAQGDPLSFVDDPVRGARTIARVLQPGGCAVVSVDSRFGGIEPFTKRDDIEGMAAFLKSGAAEWLTDRPEERFPTHAFTPKELRDVATKAGLTTVDVIGKTVFDLRGNHPWLADRETRRRMLDLETLYGGTELGLGRAHHLQAVWTKPAAPP